MAKSFARVEAAAIDGRMQTIFFRQIQLERLHATLFNERTAVEAAIVQDQGSTSQEAAIEVDLTLRHVSQQYAGLKPTLELEREYRVAHGKDATDRVEGYGVVYIEPTSHTMLYSVIVPLSSALAAGNCVVVLLENTLRSLFGLLRRLLRASLDADVFDIATSPIQDESTLNRCLRVAQASDGSRPELGQLVSQSNLPVVAVVDRTANLVSAAEELVMARFSFAASSPYAPDVVLINEFVKQQFLEAVLEARKKLPKDSKGLKTSTSIDGRIVADSVVEVRSTSNIGKVSEPVLALQPFRSLDHATMLCEGEFLAAYLFSDLVSAKYLSQNIAASASFINHVPGELLVGPAYPAGHEFDSSTRYPSRLFTRHRPAFVKASGTSLAISKGGLEHEKALVVVKRSEGGGVGFFEQGFLINASLILFSVVGATGMSIWWLRAGRPQLW